MMVQAKLVVLGMVGAAFAQSSAYTGPMFNPSEAAFFGPNSLVIPTLTDAVPTTIQTPMFITSRIPSAPFSVSAPAYGSASHSAFRSNSTSVYSSASHSMSQNATRSASSSSQPYSSLSSTSLATSTSASRTASAASSASAPAQSTGAASVNVPGVVGAIGGGLFVGLAML